MQWQLCRLHLIAWWPCGLQRCHTSCKAVISWWWPQLHSLNLLLSPLLRILASRLLMQHEPAVLCFPVRKHHFAVSMQYALEACSAKAWSLTTAPDSTQHAGCLRSMLFIAQEPFLLSGRAQFSQHAGPQRGCCSSNKSLACTFTSTRLWTPCRTPWWQLLRRSRKQQPCSSQHCCC